MNSSAAGSAAPVLGEGGAGGLTLWGVGWEWWLCPPLVSRVVCWNLDYSCRTEARLVCSIVPNCPFSDRPAQRFHWQKECTKVPVHRRHPWSCQLCPQTRALLITWQENCSGLPFSHSAGLFSFSFLRLLEMSHCRTLDQIPSHCWMKIGLNAMTKHWVSYWVTSQEPFSILGELLNTCAGEKKNGAVGWPISIIWRGAWVVAHRKTSNLD